MKCFVHFLPVLGSFYFVVVFFFFFRSLIFALDERNHVQFFCIVRLYRSIKIDLSSMAAAAAAAGLELASKVF